MYKAELTKRLIDHVTEKYPQLTENLIKESVDVLIDYIIAVLLHGGRMEIRGFGSFDLKHFPARKARNPKTGKPVEMSARYRLAFKAAKKLKLRLNSSYR